MASDALRDRRPEAFAAAPDPVIPFGRWRGRRCSQIPATYLDWLIGQDWLRPGLRLRIEAHLATRADWKRIPTHDED